MRNEEKNVIRKLKSMIGEISDLGNTKLYVFDSCSDDSTAYLAREFLTVSKLPEARWKVISLDVPVNRSLLTEQWKLSTQIL